MTIREAILTAHILDMSTVGTDTARPSTAAITAARQKLDAKLAFGSDCRPGPINVQGAGPAFQAGPAIPRQARIKFIAHAGELGRRGPAIDGGA